MPRNNKQQFLNKQQHSMEARQDQMPRIAIPTQSNLRCPTGIQTIQRDAQSQKFVRFSGAHVEGLVQTLFHLLGLGRIQPL